MTTCRFDDMALLAWRIAEGHEPIEPKRAELYAACLDVIAEWGLPIRATVEAETMRLHHAIYRLRLEDDAPIQDLLQPGYSIGFDRTPSGFYAINFDAWDTIKPCMDVTPIPYRSD